MIPAIDIDKFSAVAKALGLVPWQVFRQVEQELTTQSSSSPVLTPVPDAFITQFEHDFNVGLYDYAAHPGFNDEPDNRGEESQIPDEWEEGEE